MKLKKDYLTYKGSYLITQETGRKLDEYCKKHNVVKCRFVAAAIKAALKMKPKKLTELTNN